ncbi:MAG: hypothetical protein ACON38_02915 [Akkermansiaceae bacterium]
MKKYRIAQILLGIALMCGGLSEAEIIQSRTFYEKEEVRLTATPELPWLLIGMTEGFKNPQFEFLREGWAQELTTPSWIHYSLGRNPIEPKRFDSSFFLPISSDLLDFQSPLPVFVVNTEFFAAASKPSVSGLFLGGAAARRSQTLPPGV